MTEVQDPGGNILHTYEYNGHGQILREVDGEGKEVLYTYNDLGWKIREQIKVQETDPALYRVIAYTYDSQGNKVEEAYGQQEVERDGEPDGWHRIHFSYDKNNHLNVVKDDFGAKMRYDYDCLGNVTLEERAIADGVHSVIHYAYNKNGWLVQRTEEIQGNGPVQAAVTRYVYDANGNPMDDIGSRWFIGQPISVNYDYRFIGIWQITDPSNPNGQQDPNYRYSIPGYMKYHDKDGVNDITPADKEIIGSAIPKVTMGMTNTFRYKNVSLSVFLNAQLGQTANNWLYDVSHNSYRQNRLMVDFWTPENPTNKYPKNSLDTSVNPMSAGFYEKTDFLRVQDVTLAYRVPQRWLKKISLNRLEVYMNIKNLATWTSWTGLDPEFISDQQSTPQVRSFTFGLKLDL